MVSNSKQLNLLAKAYTMYAIALGYWLFDTEPNTTVEPAFAYGK